MTSTSIMHTLNFMDFHSFVKDLWGKTSEHMDMITQNYVSLQNNGNQPRNQTVPIQL